MPLALKNGLLIYIAHPRKTAGNTIIRSLGERGWKIRWLASGPIKSHATATEYQPMFTAFAQNPRHVYLLARHPEARLSSTYRYFHEHRHITSDTYKAWINQQLDQPTTPVDNSGGTYLSRLADYIPTGLPWTLLRYEDGINQALHTIDPAIHSTMKHLEPSPPADKQKMRLDRATKDRLLRHFAGDFTTFGYEPREWA